MPGNGGNKNIIKDALYIFDKLIDYEFSLSYYDYITALTISYLGNDELKKIVYDKLLSLRDSVHDLIIIERLNTLLNARQ
jgi:hypothetical protein